MNDIIELCAEFFYYGYDQAMWDERGVRTDDGTIRSFDELPEYDKEDYRKAARALWNGRRSYRRRSYHDNQ